MFGLCVSVHVPVYSIWHVPRDEEAIREEET